MSMMSGKDGGTARARRLGKTGPDINASSDNGGDRRRGANGVVSMGRCVATGLRRGAAVVESIIVCLCRQSSVFMRFAYAFHAKWTN
jgi:hypothetical protein